MLPANASQGTSRVRMAMQQETPSQEGYRTMASAEMRAGANERYMLRYVFCMSEVNNSSCGLMDKAPPSYGGDCGLESRLE